MLKRVSWLAIALLALVIATPSRAASGDPLRYHGWIGYSGIAGDASDFVKDGWSVGFGVLWTPQKGFLQQFAKYCLTIGQKYGAALDFAPLPKVVQQAGLQAVASL